MEETEGIADLVELVRTRAALPSPEERRALRLNAKLTRTEIANVVGVTRQAIGKWESGARTPTGDHLRRYLMVLDAVRSAA